MNTAELKLLIFRKIDSLEKNKLQEIYGVLMNYINGHKDINDWAALTEKQKQGLFDAISEIDSGKWISHEKVISKYRKKYLHA